MKTVPMIIDDLGGSGPLAKRLGFKYQSRVSNWTSIGIPRQHWPDILDLAAEREISLTLDDLRIAETALLGRPTGAAA